MEQTIQAGTVTAICISEKRGTQKKTLDTAQYTDPMFQVRQQILQCLLYRLRTAGQIDDQGTAPEPADSTAEHCTGSDRHRIIADCIGNAVCHTVTDSDRSLRCDIPHGKSCTASGKDHMHLPLIGQTL